MFDDALYNIRTIETENFRVEVDACPEYDRLTDVFGREEHIQEEQDAVDRGEAVLFTARCRVTHKPSGMVLGTDYLGMCCYNSYDEFAEIKDGYCTDMILVAVQEARDAWSDVQAGHITESPY